MKIIRSWPSPDQAVAATRPRVIDDCERIYVPAANSYRELLTVGTDFIHLDWDVAVGRNELRAFAAKCHAESAKVRVAPYQGYLDYGWLRHRSDADTSFWNLWRIEGEQRFPVRTGEPFCNLFGFGFVYIPYKIFRAYADTVKDGVIRDIGFGYWYWETTGQPVPVEWDVRTVHLHYSMRSVL